MPAAEPRSREEMFKELFPEAPAFRWRQLAKALFASAWRNWGDATNLPKEMKERLAAAVPWTTYAEAVTAAAQAGDTYKTALKLLDGSGIETVLMRNKRGEWTVCVSSQVGCAMKCAFCATGRMGLARSLNADEIVDQVRFWRGFLAERGLPGRISNVVFMGMGEPLANYENVKKALKILLAHAGLGPTHITVSTVGLIPRLEALLDDRDWPPVRLAVSLHSADLATRQKLMPTTYDRFLGDLADWCRRYARRLGNRRHHLTFEYILLAGVNDTDRHAELLAKFAADAGRVKINLIPYNFTGSGFSGSAGERAEQFVRLLTDRGLTATRRRSLGEDIAAACGQLILESKKK